MPAVTFRKAQREERENGFILMKAKLDINGPTREENMGRFLP